jgi:hypothetical protein
LEEERIAQDLGPLYVPQVARLTGVVESYRPEQLELIAEFLERVVSEPYGAQEIARLSSQAAGHAELPQTPRHLADHLEVGRRDGRSLVRPMADAAP